MNPVKERQIRTVLSNYTREELIEAVMELEEELDRILHLRKTLGIQEP